MLTNYVYLLQEREFIKTNEKIYKIGMTTKPNHTRFNQYPKGSTLLFQIICNDCCSLEKQILSNFKSKFILRKDIGNEYFEGNFTEMIFIISDVVIKSYQIHDDTVTKVAKKYVCDLCEYSSINKNNYNKHLLTSKHIKVEHNTNRVKQFNCECGKHYKSKQGLWKHKKIYH